MYENVKDSGRIGLYGIVGYPLGHSLSPLMHNAAFKACGINAVYIPFETDDIRGCVNAVRTLGIKGVSVTIPHKTVVPAMLDEVDPWAEKTGAVNTIVNDGGRLKGYNTDGSGALMALRDLTEPYGSRCLIIGAGGSARAIGMILNENRVEITVTNRSVERGKRLAGELACSFIPLDELKSLDFDILVQTTPVGMYPEIDRCPVCAEILRPDTVVMDIIYNPVETVLMKEAGARGCRVVGGSSMLVYQGAEQFRLWTGFDAPVETMFAVVEKRLMPGKGH